MEDKLEQSSATKSMRQTCALTGKSLPVKSLVSLGSLRPSLVELVQRDFPDLPLSSLVSIKEVDRYRSKYVEQLLLAEHGELTELDKQVALSLANHDTIAENIEKSYEDGRSIGDRFADNLAQFGGSWTFLIGFGVVLTSWILFNSVIDGKFDFDPYPFVFLNLILSCVAAVQAPVILMSQRRSELKDRLRAQSDYRVNLKAELEIRHLHEKMDHLIAKQWQRLLEIQQLQLETMQQDRHSQEAKYDRQAHSR